MRYKDYFVSRLPKKRGRANYLSAVYIFIALPLWLLDISAIAQNTWECPSLGRVDYHTRVDKL